MAGKDLALKILINAEDKASSVLKSLQKNAGKIATAIAGYFSIKAFSGMVDDARAFEKQMDTVAAVSGATAEDLKKLEEAAKQMGATTQFTATEAAQALESLARAGLNADQQMQALPQVLALAQANGLELNEAASLVTRTVAGMGLSFEDSARVADVLTKAASSANTSVEGLGQALSYAAPVAQSLGLTLEQTTAYLAKLADAGIDASRAGTGLNNMMIQFQNPASRFRRELENLGITTDNFNEAITQLASKGKGGEAAILALGQEAGPALRALLNQGIPALKELTTTLEDSGGAAKKAADTMTDNLDGAYKGLGSVWEGLRLQLSQPILEPLKNALVFVAGYLQSLVEDGTISRVGEFIAETFDRGAKAFQSFIKGVDFRAVGQAAQAFGANFRQVFNAAASIAGTLLNSIGSVYEALSQSGAFETFRKTAGGAIDAVVTGIQTLSTIITDAFTKLAESQAFNEFATAASGALDTVIDVSKSLSQPFLDLFSLLTGQGKTDVESFGQSTGSVLITLTQTATVWVSAFANGLNVLRAGFFGLAGVGAELVSTLLGGIGSIQSGLAQVTFGEVSKKWQAAADESKLISESFAESAKQNFEKAGEAMQEVAKSSEKTNESLAKLAGTGLQDTTNQAADATKQVSALTDAANNLDDGKTLTITADTSAADTDINRLEQPTGSEHGINPNAAEAFRVIEQLKQPTSSVHTVHVQRIDSGAPAGAPAQALRHGGTVGDLLRRYAEGGYETRRGKLPGYGGGDKVRALLEAGEFIVRKEAVQKLGTPILHLINQGRLPDAPIKRAAGGPVGDDDEIRRLFAELQRLDKQRADLERRRDQNTRKYYRAGASTTGNERYYEGAAALRLEDARLNKELQGTLNKLSSLGQDVSLTRGGELGWILGDPLRKNKTYATLNGRSIDIGKLGSGVRSNSGQNDFMNNLMAQFQKLPAVVGQAAQSVSSPASQPERRAVETVSVNLTMGGKTATGEFENTAQTRALLEELRRANAVMQ